MHLEDYLLTRVDTKTSSSFCCMIARTKCFHWNISRSIHNEAVVSVCTINVLYIMVFKTKIGQRNVAVSQENVVGNNFCEYSTELTSIFHCNFYVIRYYHLTENCRKASNFKYQNVVFHLLPTEIFSSFHLYIK